MVIVNNEEFIVNTDEFNMQYELKYDKLHIIPKLGEYERIVSLIKELALAIKINHCIFSFPTHGGFLPIKTSSFFQHINIINCRDNHNTNILKNIEAYHISNIAVVDSTDIDNKYCELMSIKPTLMFCEEYNETMDLNSIEKFHPILVTTYNVKIHNLYNNVYNLSDSDLYIYIPSQYMILFYTKFRYYIENPTNYKIDEYKNKNKIKTLRYDNLINFCMIVKNAGDLFEQVLLDNLHIIDKWTILDTGSTDNTVAIINKVLVGKKEGTLYQEPFVNFRDTRNRCLELAGKDCKYNIMLDDTYIANPNIRTFLQNVRGDNIADSFTVKIISDNDVDIEYSSNRITRSDRNLRYIYTIHEIIQTTNNNNFGLPKDIISIQDRNSLYMLERSQNRQEYDLKCLYDMIEEDPDNVRQYYYIAQTYKGMKNYKKAAEYYFKRAFHKTDGFLEEKYDALYEYAYIKEHCLHETWEECEKYYKLFQEYEPTRPDGYFMIAMHYFNSNNNELAFQYFKKTFEIGFPYCKQYSLKPNISFIFTPYYLAFLCYMYNDYTLGLNAVSLYLQKNNENAMFYTIMVEWYNYYTILSTAPPTSIHPIVPDNDIFCFICTDNYNSLTLSSIEKYISFCIPKNNDNQNNQKKIFEDSIIVFFDCEEDFFSDEFIKFFNIQKYCNIISEYQIKHCIITDKNPNLLPVSINGHVENIHYVITDDKIPQNILPIHSKIKNIFCISEKHKSEFIAKFGGFSHISTVI